MAMMVDNPPPARPREQVVVLELVHHLVLQDVLQFFVGAGVKRHDPRDVRWKSVTPPVPSSGLPQGHWSAGSRNARRRE